MRHYEQFRWILCSLLAISFFSGHYVEAKNTSFVHEGKAKLKILAVFGHPGKSHQDVFQPLLNELARRGHDLTVISFFPRSDVSKAKEPLPNYKDVSLLDSSKGHVFLDVVDLNTIKHSLFTGLLEIFHLKYMADYACESASKSENLKEFLRANKNEKFDLVVTENFNTDCYLGILHRFPAPYMALSSHQIMPWAAQRYGDPEELSYTPVIVLGLSTNMNFIERLTNVFATVYLKTFYNFVFWPSIQATAEKIFGPGVPDLREIGMNSSALLLNTHMSLHRTRPHLPNIVEVGGLHIPPKTNPLPSDIKKFLDEANEGVLYFNLGSMIKAASLPPQKLSVILAVLGSLPRKVIWKWEVEQVADMPKNVMVRKWLPQFDILNHPNVKCYLGHGGLLGLSEGVYTGTPMVLMPMYGDQFHNSAAATERGIAVLLEFNDLSERTLKDALDKVFNDTSYLENAKKISKAFRDRPASPLETAVWWTEYIGRGNGNAYLRNPGAKQCWFQRYLVDVGLFLLFVILTSLYVVYWLISCLVRAFRGKPKLKGDAKKSKKRD